MNPIEAIAALLCVVNVLLLVRRNIWNYPFGLAGVALYARVYFAVHLYSDALLQAFFFAIQLYGWWAWWRVGGNDHAVRVERLTPAARAAWIAQRAQLSVAWGSMMGHYTDAAFPMIDAAIAVASIAAQILLTRRCVENWVLWIAVDLASIALYAAKHLYPTVLLYAVFLVLSCMGLAEWLRVGRREAAAA